MTFLIITLSKCEYVIKGLTSKIKILLKWYFFSLQEFKQSVNFTPQGNNNLY